METGRVFFATVLARILRIIFLVGTTASRRVFSYADVVVAALADYYSSWPTSFLNVSEHR